MGYLVTKLDQIYSEISWQLRILYAINSIVWASEYLILQDILKYLLEKKWWWRIDHEHDWLQYVIVVVLQILEQVLMMLIRLFNFYPIFVYSVNWDLMHLGKLWLVVILFQLRDLWLEHTLMHHLVFERNIIMARHVLSAGDGIYNLESLVW